MRLETLLNLLINNLGTIVIAVGIIYGSYKLLQWRNRKKLKSRAVE